MGWSRAGSRRKAKAKSVAATSTSGQSAIAAKTPAKGKPAARGKQQAPVDDDMAEIEALLKSRGIE